MYETGVFVLNVTFSAIFNRLSILSVMDINPLFNVNTLESLSFASSLLGPVAFAAMPLSAR